MIEKWRRDYNTKRSHSSLAYRLGRRRRRPVALTRHRAQFPVLAGFARRHPSVTVSVVEEITSVLLEHLHEGRVDIVLLALPVRGESKSGHCSGNGVTTSLRGQIHDYLRSLRRNKGLSAEGN